MSLHPSWQALVRRLCVTAGALTALVSLAQHTPVWVACMRGALAFLVARLVARWGLMLLAEALAADRASGAESDES